MTSTHKSANKSNVMAEGLVSTACPQITKTHGARQKNPSVVRVVLQQIARVVTHISSRSKQCVTISVGEEQSVGAKGCEEQEGEEEEVVVAAGGDPTLPAHSPIRVRGQSPAGSRNSLTNRQHAAPPTVHCQNTKLFLDLFEAPSGALKGNGATSRILPATAPLVKPRAKSNPPWETM